jgi:hypothetical protein
MGLLDRINYKNFLLKNAEPNAIEETGIDTDDTITTDKDSVDLITTVPFKVKRTIKNCRFAANDPIVKGIINDTITKTISNFIIEGDNQDAADYITDRCKSTDWDINQVMRDLLWGGQVDGEVFMNKIIIENKTHLRMLAFDAENYRIKKIYDEYGRVTGFKQLTQRNKDTNKGWLAKKFEELEEKLEEWTVPFQPGEIINAKYMELKGKGRSIVMDILDPVYYRRVLSDLMPKTVFKNSNILIVTMGNKDAPGKRLTKQSREAVVEATTDYHKKGVVVLPFGLEAEMVGTSNLPDIPSYKQDFKNEIFDGLSTPHALFDTEGSNRATAEVLMDSETSGRVVFLEYNREWLKKYIENELFAPELELAGKKGKVWINFHPEKKDEKTAYMDSDENRAKPKSNKEDEDEEEDVEVDADGD